MPTYEVVDSAGAILASAVVSVGSGTVRHATPSTFAAVFAAANGGDTVLLAAGAYGSFSGGVKPSTVTLAPEAGATVTMAGGTFVGSAYITLKGVGFTAGVALRDNSHHIVFDGCTFDNLDQATWEGRLSLNLGAHDCQVKNSRFSGNARCSDGVFVGDAPGNLIGPGNEFVGIKQGSCSAHCDAIQLYDGPRTQIIGNYFHDCDTHIMAPDGGDHIVITDNVFVAGSYNQPIQLGSHDGDVFEHNVLIGPQTAHYAPKVGNPANRNGVFRNNIFVTADLNTTQPTAAINTVVDHNMFSRSADQSGTNVLIATPSFAGGASPTTYAGYTLAAGSPGKGNGSDSLDHGIRISGG